MYLVKSLCRTLHVWFVKVLNAAKAKLQRSRDDKTFQTITMKFYLTLDNGTVLRPRENKLVIRGHTETGDRQLMTLEHSDSILRWLYILLKNCDELGLQKDELEGLCLHKPK